MAAAAFSPCKLSGNETEREKMVAIRPDSREPVSQSANDLRYLTAGRYHSGQA